MSDDLAMSALELVKAVFRLAFCDYVGKAYGHDEPYDDKYTRINPELQAEAATFLTSPWAIHLGDLAGFPAQRVWKQAQRNVVQRPAMLPRPERATAPMQLIATSEELGNHLQEDGEVAA